MKIAVITSTFPPYKGGMGNSAYELASTLARENEVSVFTLCHSEIELVEGEESRSFAIAQDDKTKVTRIKPSLSFGFKNGGFIPKLYKYLRKGHSVIASEAKQSADKNDEIASSQAPRNDNNNDNKFDVIYLHYPFFGGAEIVWLFKLLNPKIKLIIHFHMDTPALSRLGKFLSLPSLLIRKSLFKRADKVISASLDYVAHSSVKNYFKKWPDKFCEIPFGVHLNKFHVLPHDISALKALRQKYNISDKDRVVMFLGALDEAHKFKGVNILLRAAASTKYQVSSIKYLICGDGDLKNKYEELAEELGIKKQVIFTGRVADDELTLHYNLADIFVLPSIDKSEAFGMVLLEAMACGVPVMASNLPGVRSVFENGVEGYTVAPGSERHLRSKLEEYLRYPHMRLKMGRAARDLVEKRYSWDKVAESIRRQISDNR